MTFDVQPTHFMIDHGKKKFPKHLGDSPAPGRTSRIAAPDQPGAAATYRDGGSDLRQRWDMDETP